MFPAISRSGEHRLVAGVFRCLLLILAVLAAQGCSTMANGRAWGEDVTWPGLDNLGSSALHAAMDVETWIPAAGALVFGATKLDREVSDWAADENPVFGSENSADRASDILRDMLAAAMLGTALATPGGPDTSRWFTSKAKGLSAEVVAWGVPQTATHLLKVTTNRERPNAADRRSFPSGHTTHAYAAATLASRNVEAMSLSSGTRFALRSTFKTLAGLTGWARIEARKHYPSDVLAGIALSHFLSVALHDSLLNLQENTSVFVKPDRELTLVIFSRTF